MLYLIGRLVFFVLALFFFKYRALGRESVPRTGGVIIASNHASYLDPIFVGIGTSRVLHFMARESLFENFFFSTLIRLVHTFPIKRNFQDVGAMREAISRLKKGKALLIFPEATRTRDGNLQSAKAGISYLAYAAGVPVVPAYIKGSYEVLPKGARSIRPAPVRVYFGAPLDFSEFMNQADYKNVSDAYRPFADYIMQQIARLKENSR